MLSAWLRTTQDPRNHCDLIMSGEDIDLGVPAPLAGYLGKTSERASLVENCPRCGDKGQICALRSYRINFQDSIMLCTNPQCLFPLLSKPLEDILTSITTGEGKADGKRKNHCSPDEGDPVPALKRQRTGDDECADGLVCRPSNVVQSHTDLSQVALSLREHDYNQAADSSGLQKNMEPIGSVKGPCEPCSETREQNTSMFKERSMVELDAGPLVEQEAESSVEQETMRTLNQEAESSVEQETMLMLNQEEEPSVEQETMLTLNREAESSVEQETMLTLNREAEPSVEQETMLTLNREAEPSVEQETMLMLNQVAEPSVEQETMLTLNQEAEPSVEQETMLTLNQEAEPSVKQETMLTLNQEAEPSVEQETMLTLNQEAESSVEQETMLTLNQEAEPFVEQEARVTAEPSVEQEAEPSIKQEVEPTVELGGRLTVEPLVEQEVKLKVKQELEQSVNHKAVIMVGQKTEPSLEQKVRFMVEPSAEQEKRLKVEQEVEPSVKQKVMFTVDSTVKQEVGSLVKHQGGPVELVAAPSHLFWRNEHSLCWLDTLMVALVHCRTLIQRAANLLEDRSPVRRLCDQYSKACNVIKANEQIDIEDEIVKVPSVVFHQAEEELEEVRMSSFKLLQSKLQCKLGQRETPVFALPLFLRLDRHAEDLFQHSFHWDFECAACGHTFNNRCEKTLTTFTQVVPDWHPLHAVHRAQCSRCHHKLQRRKMVLERVSPVFALHFVEGLPQNDVTVYSFDFQGNKHVVSTVIQYDKHLKHFITWVQDASGSWLEFDDLKYPQCIAHKHLPVPADQIHIVFWEVQAVVQPGSHAIKEGSVERDDTSLGAHQHNRSPHFLQDDTYILSALTEDVDGGTSRVSVDDPDASIGTTTLLDAFEGLSHNDIVTLTLVEVKVDAEGRPLDSSSNFAVSQPASANVGLSPSVEVGGPVQCAAADSSAQSPSMCDKDQNTGGRPNLRGKEKLPSDEEIVLPSVIAPPVANPPCVETAVPVSSTPACGSPGLTALSNARWSNDLSRHPSLQSTPTATKCASATPPPKPALKLTDDKTFPAKAAEMFWGFRARGSVMQTDQSSKGNKHCQNTESRTQNAVFRQPLVKCSNPQPSALNTHKSPRRVGQPTHGSLGATLTPKGQTSVHLNKTSALRQELLKKLKAKKKKLATLNHLLGKGNVEAVHRPDSTEITSPHTVSSSTSLCSSPSYDQFVTDLLSPATTDSNLSPDSTSLLEMLTTGQEGAEVVGESVAAAQPEKVGLVVSQPTGNDIGSIKDDFLEEFMSGSEIPPCDMGNVDFNVFDMFF